MLTNPHVGVLRKRIRRRPLPARMCALALALGIGVVLGGTVTSSDAGQAGESSDTQPTNLQVSISRHADYFEIKLRSTREFPVRALPPILQIGDRFCRYSRYPDDGGLNTLIFQVPVEEFDLLKSGASMTVFYSSPDPESMTEAARRIAESTAPQRGVWTFGTFRKDLYQASDGKEATD